MFDPEADESAFPGAERVLARDRARGVRAGDGAVRRRRDPGDLGRGGAPAARSGARTSRTSGWWRRRPGRSIVRAWLRDEGQVTEERLAALRAPAGLDLGAETPEEIAISILGELVQVRRGTAAFVAVPGPATLAGSGGARCAAIEPVVDDIVLVDPVCGMTVDRAHARHLAEHDGVVYAFCRMGCRTAFIQRARRVRARPVAPAPSTSAGA